MAAGNLNIEAGGSPVDAIRHFAKLVVPRSGVREATRFTMQDDRNLIALEAHFQVWLTGKLGSSFVYGKPYDGVAWSVLHELYWTEFDAHRAAHMFTFNRDGEIEPCQ